MLTSYGPSLHNYQGMCLILLTIHQQMEFCTEVSWPCLFLCGTRIVDHRPKCGWWGKTDVPAFSCMSIERFKHTTYDQDICDAKVKVAASFRSHVIKLLTMTMPKLTAGFPEAKRTQTYFRNDSLSTEKQLASYIFSASENKATYATDRRQLGSLRNYGCVVRKVCQYKIMLARNKRQQELEKQHLIDKENANVVTDRRIELNTWMHLRLWEVHSHMRMHWWGYTSDRHRWGKPSRMSLHGGSSYSWYHFL